jgi:hypothetical protein
MIKYLILFLTLSLSAFTLVSIDILTISEVNFYVLVGIILLDYLDKKSLSLFQVWQVGFIFIILSEAILIQPGINILNAVKFLLVANYLIILGYLMPVKYKKQQGNYQLLNRVKASGWTRFILIVLVVGYVVYALPGAILSYSLGRNAAAEILWEDRIFSEQFLRCLGFVLPSIIVFYYKEIRKKNQFLSLIAKYADICNTFYWWIKVPVTFLFCGFLLFSGKQFRSITLNPKLIGFLLVLVASSFMMDNSDQVD